MKVSERLELISSIGRELQDRYTFSDLHGYLAAFDVPFLENGPTNSKWSYTKAALASVPLSTIINIASDLDLKFSSEMTESAVLPENWKGTTDFRLFISHISKDKGIATRLKEALHAHHISGFVAHEDIHPTKAWQDEIERALNSMHAMVAVHTLGFSESVWTQQEIGFALGRRTKVDLL
ncbi:MAG: toll/interleukin-1 receptor domain-containing protein [Hyphomonas sp.]